MDGDAFLFMLASWGLILGLNVMCFVLMFTKGQEPPKEHEEEEFPEEIT